MKIKRGQGFLGLRSVTVRYFGVYVFSASFHSMTGIIHRGPVQNMRGILGMDIKRRLCGLTMGQSIGISRSRERCTYPGYFFICGDRSLHRG